jgi:hypothetical protein
VVSAFRQIKLDQPFELGRIYGEALVAVSGAGHQTVRAQLSDLAEKPFHPFLNDGKPASVWQNPTRRTFFQSNGPAIRITDSQCNNLIRLHPLEERLTRSHRGVRPIDHGHSRELQH